MATLIAVPGFVLSYLLILWIANALALPVIGMRTFGLEEAPAVTRLMDALWHTALPSLMLAASGVAVLSRYVRAQMGEVLGEDYAAGAELVEAFTRAAPEYLPQAYRD